MKDWAHEIVHKESGRIVGEYKNYAEAYAAYERLGTGNDGMSDHSIGIVMVYDKDARMFVPKTNQ
jgi:hypothetical protein